jgi:threonine synthase
MDIQFAYNLERLLYFMCDEDTIYVKSIMEDVENQYNMRPNAKGAQLNASTLANIQATFSSISVSDADTLATMTRVYLENGYALCPHSAIGVFGARSLDRRPGSVWASANPMVCVLTAHASKFSETFLTATEHVAPICWWSNVEELRTKEQKFELLGKDEGDAGWQDAWVAILKASVLARHGSKKLHSA